MENYTPESVGGAVKCIIDTGGDHVENALKEMGWKPPPAVKPWNVKHIFKEMVADLFNAAEGFRTERKLNPGEESILDMLSEYHDPEPQPVDAGPVPILRVHLDGPAVRNFRAECSDGRAFHIETSSTNSEEITRLVKERAAKSGFHAHTVFPPTYQEWMD